MKIGTVTIEALVYDGSDEAREYLVNKMGAEMGMDEVVLLGGSPIRIGDVIPLGEAKEQEPIDIIEELEEDIRLGMLGKNNADSRHNLAEELLEKYRITKK